MGEVRVESHNIEVTEINVGLCLLQLGTFV